MHTIKLCLLLSLSYGTSCTLTEKMFPVCPVGTDANCLLVRGSHTIAVRSSDPDASTLERGGEREGGRGEEREEEGGRERGREGGRGEREKEGGGREREGTNE